MRDMKSVITNIFQKKFGGKKTSMKYRKFNEDLDMEADKTLDVPNINEMFEEEYLNCDLIPLSSDSSSGSSESLDESDIEISEDIKKLGLEISEKDNCCNSLKDNIPENFDNGIREIVVTDTDETDVEEDVPVKLIVTYHFSFDTYKNNNNENAKESVNKDCNISSIVEGEADDVNATSESDIDENKPDGNESAKELINEESDTSTIVEGKADDAYVTNESDIDENKPDGNESAKELINEESDTSTIVEGKADDAYETNESDIDDEFEDGSFCSEDEHDLLEYSSVKNGSKNNLLDEIYGPELCYSVKNVCLVNLNPDKASINSLDNSNSETNSVKTDDMKENINNMVNDSENLISKPENKLTPLRKNFIYYSSAVKLYSGKLRYRDDFPEKKFKFARKIFKKVFPTQKYVVNN